MFSFYLPILSMPVHHGSTGGDVAATVAHFVADIGRIVDERQESYRPEYGYNGIRDFTDGQAYVIMMFNPRTITFTGSGLVSEATLHAGTNYVGHLSLVDQNVADVFGNVNNLIMVKDVYGNVFLPERNINDIGDMQPGRGYKAILKSTADVTTLTWPESTTLAGFSGKMETGTVAGENLVVTSQDMQFIFVKPSETFDAGKCAADSCVIRAYCRDEESDIFVGEVSFNTNADVVMTVWEDNPSTTGKDGCDAENTVAFQLVHRVGTTETILPEIQFTAQSDFKYARDTLKLINFSSSQEDDCIITGCSAQQASAAYANIMADSDCANNRRSLPQHPNVDGCKTAGCDKNSANDLIDKFGTCTE